MPNVVITIGPTGKNVSVLALNIHKDLLEDYLYFRKKALNSESGMFLKARYRRAALMVLFAYTEAVVIRWAKILCGREGKPERFEKLKMRCLTEKMEFIDNRVSNPNITKDIRGAKAIRNSIVHFMPGSDISIHEGLTDELLDDIASKLNGWIRLTADSLHLDPHPNVDGIMESFSEMGTTVTAKDSGSD